MKTFRSFNQGLKEAVKGNTVFSKKVDGIDVEVVKDGPKFVAYIDGDKLDAYSSQKEAEKMALQFLKQYKG